MFKWVPACALDVGFWRCLHRAEEDYSDHPGVRWPGVHLHLHPGNVAEMGGLWLCEVFHQRLVLAGFLHRGCKCAATFPQSTLYWLSRVIVWWPHTYTPCEYKLSDIIEESLFRTKTSFGLHLYCVLYNVISNKSVSILLDEFGI